MPPLFIRSAAVAMITAAALALPVQAKPSGTVIVGVYDPQTCATAVCGPNDPTVQEGAIIDHPLQIHVRSTTGIGFEWIRLQATVGDDPRPWCVEHWVPDGSDLDFAGFFDWKNTRNWPPPIKGEWGCEDEVVPHLHGQPTENVVHHLQVVAREKVSKEEEVSDTFDLRFNYPPGKPEWVEDPKKNESANGTSVTLQWLSNETDAVEYHYVRLGPDKSESEFAVSATKPEQQGCRRTPIKINSRDRFIYSCGDSGFSASGTYTYALVTYRTALQGGSPCAISGKKCLESELSEPKTVDIATASTQSNPNTTQPNEVTVLPSAQTSNATVDENAEQPVTPLEVAPAEGRGDQIAAAAATEEDSGPAMLLLVPIAALLALGAGVASWRLLRRARP